eukprot:SAG31_NODE_1586_length_7821_cov_3.086765_9_plen_325_part_00
MQSRYAAQPGTQMSAEMISGGQRTQRDKNLMQDSDGIWVDETDRIQRLTTILQNDPESFIDKSIYKRHKGMGVYHGTVISYAKVPQSSQQLWNIQHTDDGDIECFTLEDMVKYCIKMIDGTEAKLDNDSESADEDDITDSGGDNNMFTCTDNMTYFDVCDAIGVDPGHVHTYYHWLLAHHAMGHKHRGKPGYFRDPFALKQKGKSPDKFKVNTKFPLPTGDTWTSLLDQHTYASNLANVEYANAVQSRHQFVMIATETAYDTDARRNQEDESILTDRILSDILSDMPNQSDALATSKATKSSRGHGKSKLNARLSARAARNSKS